MKTEFKSKLLTISIPTWNRAHYLNELLNDLTEQIASFNLEDEIEILISNNNSDDSTEEIVQSFKNQFSIINYNKNSSNIGAKSNVIKSMELASSEYVMVIGDDDRIRQDCLIEIIEILKSQNNLGVVIDQFDFKWKAYKSNTKVSLVDLIKNYYWLIGNAGHYIMKTEYVKKYVSENGYDFFNECWPHTQLIILGLQNSNDNCLVADINILEDGLHNEVMAYSSFYLWRTCYFELTLSINALKDKIPNNIYSAGRDYLKGSLVQQLFNILQCGIFVDDNQTRQKTYRHIFKHIRLFSTYEKILLTIISITLMLPVFISKPLSNLFILALKGKTGIQKKNEFVKSELSKKNKLTINTDKSIRALEFEK